MLAYCLAQGSFSRIKRTSLDVKRAQRHFCFGGPGTDSYAFTQDCFCFATFAILDIDISQSDAYLQIVRPGRESRAQQLDGFLCMPCLCQSDRTTNYGRARLVDGKP